MSAHPEHRHPRVWSLCVSSVVADFGKRDRCPGSADSASLRTRAASQIAAFGEIDSYHGRGNAMSLLVQYSTGQSGTMSRSSWNSRCEKAHTSPWSLVQYLARPRKCRFILAHESVVPFIFLLLLLLLLLLNPVSTLSSPRPLMRNQQLGPSSRPQRISSRPHPSRLFHRCSVRVHRWCADCCKGFDASPYPPVTYSTYLHLPAPVRSLSCFLRGVGQSRNSDIIDRVHKLGYSHRYDALDRRRNVINHIIFHFFSSENALPNCRLLDTRLKHLWEIV